MKQESPPDHQNQLRLPTFLCDILELCMLSGISVSSKKFTWEVCHYATFLNCKVFRIEVQTNPTNVRLENKFIFHNDC